MARPKLVPLNTAEPQFKIERGIPLPPKGSAVAQQASKRNGHKYTQRAVDGGVRVWRTA